MGDVVDLAQADNPNRITAAGAQQLLPLASMDSGTVRPGSSWTSVLPASVACKLVAPPCCHMCCG